MRFGSKVSPGRLAMWNATTHKDSGNRSINGKLIHQTATWVSATKHADQRLIHFQFCDSEGLDVELNGRRHIRDRFGSCVALANDHSSQTHGISDETIRVLFHNDLHIFGHFCLDIENVPGRR